MFLKLARLKLPTVSERIDVALRLCFAEAVLGLKLRYQVVFVLESGYLLVGELAPLLLDFAPHACVRSGTCLGRHYFSPENIFQHRLNDHHSSYTKYLGFSWAETRDIANIYINIDANISA
jgi:hypothetical protein